jgi:hypothetical protein
VQSENAAEPCFQDARVVAVPPQTTAGVNMDGDYLGTGRGTGGASRGRHCHSTRSLAVTDRHSLGIHTVFSL